MNRNIVIGILAHVDAGKTTLIESFLSQSGAVRKAGRVDHQDTALDYDGQERARGITIYAKEAGFSWKGQDIQVIDTPGHADFSSEMERSLGVLDLAVLIISGLDGVQAHTKTIWKLLEAHHIPTILFVNKMDLARRGEQELIANIQGELSGLAAPVDAEQIAMTDDDLLDTYMEGKLDEDVIRERFLARKYFPVLFGSALKQSGTAELLDVITSLAPDRQWPDDFSASVYKVDENGVHVKVTGGSLSVRQKLTDTEKADQLKTFRAEKLVPVSVVSAGTTCVISGVDLVPGDTLGAKRQEGIPLSLTPSMEYEMLLPDGVDPLSIASSLAQLTRQDPSLRIETDSRSVRLRLMGEVQKEVLQKKIFEMTGLTVSFSAGRPVFMETIRASVSGAGHFEPLRHYAEVHVRLDPAPGKGLTFHDAIGAGTLSPGFHTQIMSALHSKKHRGVLTGSELTDVTVTVVAARGHQKHTEGGDFRQAACRAVRQALMKGESVLLEPFSEFTIETPESYFGTVLYQLEKIGASAQAGVGCITGSAPSRKLNDLQNDLRAMTKGQAVLSVRPAGYRESPDAAQIIEEKGYDPQTDLKNSPDSVFFENGTTLVVPWFEADEHMAIDLDESSVSSVVMGHRTYSVSDAESRRVFAQSTGRNRNEKKRVIPHKKKDLTADGSQVMVSERKPSCMVIDGYNVINGWDALKGKPLQMSREELITILSNYQGYAGGRMILVFDAWKVKDGIGSQERRGAVEVVYTRAGQTADAYIEKLVSVLQKSYQLTVVTSDGMIQNSVLAKGARRVSVRELERAVTEMDASAREKFPQYFKK